MEQLRRDGAQYGQAYRRDAQYVFSRVQHHVHRKTKDGYVPLHNCAKKTKHKGKSSGCQVCKHDFPMTKLCIETSLPVCRGIAKKLGLRVAGRRNALGKIIGRRRCRWQSGTTPAFAVLFRSNSHTAPNYRLPLIPEVHDNVACPSKACAEWVRSQESTKQISKLAQRAQREATGYYTAYVYKRQPVGTKYLRSIGETLNYLQTGLQDKTPGQQWHRITHRVLTDLQHRMVARTAPEEWNLASRWHDHDPTTAEFNRTYMSDDFPGGQLLRCLESEEKRLDQQTWQKVVPKAHGRSSGPEDLLRHFPDFYGYRGNHPSVYYLSAWEFAMLWEVLPLPKPSASQTLSRWVQGASGPHESREYEPNPDAASKPSYEEPDILFYDEIPGDTQLRNRWYMRRRLRPMVPAPSNAPMPDKQRCAEKKAKLFALYLRPWVLDRLKACRHVPHLADLGVTLTAVGVARRRRAKATDASRVRNYSRAWTTYVRGQVVSRHAARLIRQFMAACCGKSTGRDEPDEAELKGPINLPENSVSLERVHRLLDSLSQQEIQILRGFAFVFT